MAEKIKAKLGNARALIVQYPGQAQKHVIEIDCELTGDKVRVSTAIRVERKEEPSDEVVKAVALTVRGSLPTYFSKKRDVFQIQEMAVTELSSDGTDYTTATEFDVSAEVKESLEEQSKHNEDAAKSFENAAKRLRAIARQGLGGIQADWSEVVRLLAYLESCLEIAELGNMYGWYREKQGGIRKYFHDLHGRKQASHPHVKLAQDYITDNLASFHAPTQWSDRPPTMSS